MAYINQGDLERGLKCCDVALSLAPLPRDAAWAKVVHGYGKIKAGQLDDGISELAEALHWFESSNMRWSHLVGMVWLAEGHLRRGDLASARPLIGNILEATRAAGNLHYEGRACWLMGEYLAVETPDVAVSFIETAMRIFEHVGARNDFAKAMLTRAALHQRAENTATARQLLHRAEAIFEALDTRDEPSRVEAALAALDSGSPIRLLADRL